jgi:hypothetical protein
MKTVAQVVAAARKEGKQLETAGLVVMNRDDFNYLLEYTARLAFEAGQAAGPAKPKKAIRKRVAKSFEFFERGCNNGENV